MMMLCRMIHRVKYKIMMTCKYEEYCTLLIIFRTASIRDGDNVICVLSTTIQQNDIGNEFILIIIIIIK